MLAPLVIKHVWQCKVLAPIDQSILTWAVIALEQFIQTVPREARWLG